MNCIDFREFIVPQTEGILDDATAADYERHLSQCPACREEHQAIARVQRGLATRAQTAAGVSLGTAVMARIREQTTAAAPAASAGRALLRWLVGGATTAAALAFVVAMSVSPASRAQASDVMTRAIAAAAGLSTVHLEARVRAAPADNFSQINPDAGFTGIEMWKEFDGEKRWRIEKPGRVTAMNGQSTTLYLRPPANATVAIPRPSRSAFDTEWLQNVADIEATLTQALKMTASKGWKMELAKRTDANGITHADVVIDTPSGLNAGDYLLNKFLMTADTRRIFAFDDQSGRLEAMQIHVRTGLVYTLVFEVTRIEYNTLFPADVFEIALPADVNRITEPRPLADNTRYAAMGPQEAARAFFEACGREDWAEAEKFMPIAAGDRVRRALGGLTLVDLGVPFTSGGSTAQFVPYEIRLRDGKVRKHNLALKPRAGRWMVDGGI